MSKEDRKDFYPTISAGLNRPLFAVYRRVKRMYDKTNYKGRLVNGGIGKKFLMSLFHKGVFGCI